MAQQEADEPHVLIQVKSKSSLSELCVDRNGLVDSRRRLYTQNEVLHPMNGWGGFRVRLDKVPSVEGGKESDVVTEGKGEMVVEGRRVYESGSGVSVLNSTTGLALVLGSLLLLLLTDLLDDLSALFRVPGTSIAKRASLGAVALAAKRLGEVLDRDLLLQLIDVAATQDLDLLNGDRVKPALDDGPDSGEDVGRVDNVELAHRFWVVVLPNVGSLLDVTGNFPELGDTDVLEVHDGARRLNKMTFVGSAHRQPLALELLVLDDELLQLPFRRRSDICK